VPVTGRGFADIAVQLGRPNSTVDPYSGSAEGCVCSLHRNRSGGTGDVTWGFGVDTDSEKPAGIDPMHLDAAEAFEGPVVEGGERESPKGNPGASSEWVS